MGDASIDGNSRATLTGVDSSDGKTPVKIYANATTHRLLVDTAANPGGTDTQVQFNNGGNFGGAKILYNAAVNAFEGAPDFRGAAFKGGDENGTGSAGGDATLLGGKGGAAQEWTGATIRAGGGSSDDNEGGPIEIGSGVGNETGEGGEVQIYAGDGGNVSGAGGTIEIEAGNAQAGDSDGGNIELTPGVETGTGTPGYIILANLPTSASGLPTGALWNSSGTLKVA